MMGRWSTTRDEQKYIKMNFKIKLKMSNLCLY